MRTLSYYLEMANTDEGYRITNDYISDGPSVPSHSERPPIRLRNIPNEAGIVLFDIVDFVKLGQFDENEEDDDGEGEYISLDFAQKYVQILRGEVPEWYLCDVTIRPNFVLLAFGNRTGTSGECLHISAPWPPYLNVMFEVAREDRSFEKYHLTICSLGLMGNEDRSQCNLTLTEYDRAGRRELNFLGSRDDCKETRIHVTEYR